MSFDPRTLALFLSVSLAASAASAQTSPIAPLPPPIPPRTATATQPALPPPPPASATQPALPPPPPASATQPALPPPPPAASTQTPTLDANGAGRTRPRAYYRERMRMLDRNLLTLPERSRDSRVTSGLINLAVGAGLVGLGFAPIWGDTGPTVPQYLIWFQGGYTLAQGAVELAWAPARERLSRQYIEMPVRTAAQRRARVRFGEEALDEIAADGRRRRILTAVTSVVYGLGTLGIFYRDQIFNGEPLPSPEGLNYLVIGSIGIQSLVSIIGAFSTSSDERMRDTYQRELQLLRESDDTTE